MDTSDAAVTEKDEDHHARLKLDITKSAQGRGQRH
jgi:hypothetical protein